VRARVETAPAKINLTLRVLGRRADGFHDIESVVSFAGVGDALSFIRGADLDLAVRGPTAAAAGKPADNLVIKAACALAREIPGLQLGRFVLTKRLPVAAGLGGGSSDAGAALRLLARANRLSNDDPRLMRAARSTGADVPVCLDPRPRLMRGIGDILSGPLQLPALHAVLVNPGVPVPTKRVFEGLNVAHASAAAATTRCTGMPGGADWVGKLSRAHEQPGFAAMFLAFLTQDRNDLEEPGIAIAPIIRDVLAELRATEGCRLARMSGSGATCFGLYETARAAASAARSMRSRQPAWWVRATALGG
jgi:4-diphosphocytidyl-2-C-methyl-D-erythritol kinase